MARPGPEARAEYRTRLPQAFTPEMRLVASQIGAGPLTKPELVKFKGDLFTQLGRGVRNDQSGLSRLKAIKTGVQPITEAQWQAVRNGATALLAEGGGTNINVMTATKRSDTELEISGKLEPTIEVPTEERPSSWSRFIGRIAEPLSRQAAILGRDGQPVSIGLSLGQPNRNVDQLGGIGAYLIPNADGTLSNNYVITDYDEIPDREKEVMGAIGRSIHNINGDIRLGAMVGENDTLGNGQDRVGATQATRELQAQGKNVLVLPNGHVKGTGNNDAILMNPGFYPVLDYAMQQGDAGYVNTEDGNAEVVDNWVSQRARAILIDRRKLKPEGNKSILERRTGEHAIARLAAATEIFAEMGLIDIPNRTALTDALLEESIKNQALMSDIATGNFPPFVLTSETKQIIQGLAQGLREQEAQIYGIQYAVMLEASGAEKPEDTTRVSLTEGSAIHLGIVGPDSRDESGAKMLTNREYAQEVAAGHGEVTEIFKSSGMRGIAVATLVKAAEFDKVA